MAMDSSSGIKKASSASSMSCATLLVIRPCPIPSVNEEPDLSRLLPPVLTYEVHLATEQLKRLDLGWCLGVGHIDHHVVALGTGNVCKTNPRVSCCSFNDGSARLDESLSLCLLDEEQSGSVFDGPARVHPLGLSIDVAANFVAETVESDERGVSHGAGQALCRGQCLERGVVRARNTHGTGKESLEHDYQDL
ncbi:hypothetical protein OGAPHI_004639 [Ogataea philodendri]|uniref:Uncharacterized protein n=1 Tax=Ogataea philodendri TaxID=1378263 RepID=A0A9P8P3Q0_9ASCO|nr:uncharacterized protein OGAPHI_004639 [Ogataea philodendri]KAH3664287.1 hypothetical protein OGAPHI_004639 [Ogataea philodendri]